MANKLYEENDIRAIADAIRAKNGSADTYKPSEMAEAIEAIPTGGGGSLKALLDETKRTSQLFYGYTGTTVQGLIGFDDTSNVTDMSNMFIQSQQLTSVPLLNTSKVTNMRNMFDNCRELTSVPLFDMSNVTNAQSMFYYCYNLTSISIGVLNHARETFHSCRRLVCVDIGKMNVVGDTLNTNFMFCYCYSLKKFIIRAGAGVDGNTVPTISTNAFYDCYHIDGTVNATYNPTGAKDCFIYVPDDMLDAWKSATNWSVYASQIKGISELSEESE